MILIIDNYDSFTWNLYQYLCELSPEPVRVARNDRVSLEEVERLAPSRLVLSPGPGRPEGAGICLEAVRRFAGRIPILGVCLGHQVIAQAFGARIVPARRIVHGKTEQINLDGRGLFRGIPLPATVTRYHSLAVEAESLPEELEITATSLDGEIMGLRHRVHAVEGVQFHPESVGTPLGKRLLSNFLVYKREPFPAAQLLSRVLSRVDLSFLEMEEFMEELTDGNLNGSQIAGFLVGLNAKGYSPREIAGAASVLRRKKTPFPADGPLLDTCGTGGDGIGTFNISSLAAVTAAACGARVAKHGNRAVSSSSGSADFFRALGVPTELEPAAAAELLAETGFAFLFAPQYHPAMRHAAQVRRELGMKTILNLAGPLANPAEARFQLLGVFAEGLCRPVAEAARLLGVERAMVVHGLDGQDEISVTGPTRVVSLEGGEVRESLFEPSSLGLPEHPLEALRVGTAEENAAVARRLLAGERAPEAIRDAVLLNSGAALAVAGLASGIEEGYRKARAALEEGRVRDKLERIAAVGRELAGRAAAAQPLGCAPAGDPCGVLRPGCTPGGCL
jgi:anthranilate synthase/phosphoribosyltransferase